MRLSDYAAAGRQNNFNLVRISAAFAVLISHSYPLTLGAGSPDLMGTRLGVTLGHVAVDVFFITSGFLVTSSLLKRQSTLAFIWARILRIYPANLVMLLLSTFVLGASFTTLTLHDYLQSKVLYTYLAKCAVLITGVVYELPGVFESNRLPRAVNGSLWTMPFELKMYAILAIVWAALKLTGKYRTAVLERALIVFATVSGIFVIADHFWFHLSQYFAHLFYMFFVGAAYYALRTSITLARTPFICFAITLLLSTAHPNAFFVAYTCLLPYLVLYLAYVPGGFLRRYNNLGDYSYGVYIYAFPIQQTVAALFPAIAVWQMVFVAGVFTLVFAVLSWHLVEERSLRLKDRGRQSKEQLANA